MNINPSTRAYGQQNVPARLTLNPQLVVMDIFDHVLEQTIDNYIFSDDRCVAKSDIVEAYTDIKKDIVDTVCISLQITPTYYQTSHVSIKHIDDAIQLAILDRYEKVYRYLLNRKVFVSLDIRNMEGVATLAESAFVSLHEKVNSKLTDMMVKLKSVVAETVAEVVTESATSTNSDGSAKIFVFPTHPLQMVNVPDNVDKAIEDSNYKFESIMSDHDCTKAQSRLLNRLLHVGYLVRGSCDHRTIDCVTSRGLAKSSNLGIRTQSEVYASVTNKLLESTNKLVSVCGTTGLLPLENKYYVVYTCSDIEATTEVPYMIPKVEYSVEEASQILQHRTAYAGVVDKTLVPYMMLNIETVDLASEHLTIYQVITATSNMEISNVE